MRRSQLVNAMLSFTLPRFCNAVIHEMSDLITLPDAKEAQELADITFMNKHFPQVWAAIDGCHIPITVHEDGCKDYINRKQWASYVLQGVVDRHCM